MKFKNMKIIITFEDNQETPCNPITGEYGVAYFTKDVIHECGGTTSRVLAQHFLDILLHRYSKEILHNSNQPLFHREIKAILKQY